ncbi:MAG: hypothetical protein DSY55_04380 [Clostridia bacterium]|nr:MAG: hypothetical protein DSY55_04380 [Clostridia bacterium]
MGSFIQLIDQASIPFLVWLQGAESAGLTLLMGFLSYLGTEYFFLLFLPLIYWTISKRWGVLTALSLVFSSYVAGFVKWTFNLSRPPSPPVHKLWHETSPSFISGHATTAMAVWGTLAMLVQRTWFWLLATILIFGIGFSRLYLGVHYPGDVVGGWIAGVVVAWAVVAGTPKVERAVRSWSSGRMLAASLGLALILVLIHPRWPDGNLWPAPDAIQLGGLLFGILAGLVWDVKALHFHVAGPWLQRLQRFTLGIILLALFYVLPKMLLDALNIDSYGLLQGVRFLRYALVGFVVSGLAPWLFQRLHLA